MMYDETATIFMVAAPILPVKKVSNPASQVPANHFRNAPSMELMLKEGIIADVLFGEFSDFVLCGWTMSMVGSFSLMMENRSSKSR